MVNIIQRLKTFFYYQRVVLYGYDLKKRHDFELNTDMTLCVATEEDIDRLFEDKKNTDLTSIKWDIWKEKCSNGLWKGFFIKDRESIVAQAFYSIENIFFGGTKWVELKLPLHSAYGFKLFTRPDYRGKGLGQAVTSFRLNSAKSEGIERFYTIILSDNKISRHNEEKIGGYHAGSVIFLKCKFFNKVFLSPRIYREGIRVKNISDF